MVYYKTSILFLHSSDTKFHLSEEIEQSHPESYMLIQISNMKVAVYVTTILARLLDQ